MSTTLLLNRFITGVEKNFGIKIKIKRKKDIWWHKTIAFLFKPFNPRYMNYVTTIFSTIYVPDWWDVDEETSLTVLIHEMIHVYDSSRNKYFGFLYLSPQIIFPIVSILLALAFSPWWLLLFLGVALPLPSPWRYKAELRGYRTLLLYLEKYLKIDSKSEEMTRQKDFILEQLTKQWYFFAMPFPKKVLRDLEETEWKKEPVYQFLILFLLHSSQGHK